MSRLREAPCFQAFSLWSAHLFRRRPRLRKQAPALAIAFLLIVTAGMSDAAGQGISKLYVSNSEGDDITVIDLATYAVIGNIRVG